MITDAPRMHLVEESLALSMVLENEFLLRASHQVARARQANDETARDRHFDEAAELRRLAEIAGAICRNLEAERERQRPPSTREAEHLARRRCLPKLRIVGGGA